MAISPAVQQYQQQIMQSNTNITPEQVSFNKKFGDHAFTTLNSKFPGLQKYVVTFKVVDSDLESNTATGAFVVRKDKDVVYIPVILADGQLASLEMLYDKAKDSFVPLTNSEIKSISATNEITDPKVISKAPYVEDTKNLFRRMFRPPASSNIVLSSSQDGVGNLPNEAKAALLNALAGNEQLVEKVASFYDPRVLAQKLSLTEEKTAKEAQVAPEQRPILPAVIKIADLAKQASALLDEVSEQEYSKAQGRGYLLNIDDNAATCEAVGMPKLASEIVTRMNLTTVYPHSNLYGTGYVLYLGKEGIARKRCVVLGEEIFTEDGEVEWQKYSNNSPMVISDFEDGVCSSDIIGVGGKYPEDLPSETPENERYIHKYIVYKTKRNDCYRVLSDVPNTKPSRVKAARPVSLTSARMYPVKFRFNATRNNDGDIELVAHKNVVATFTSSIDRGYLCQDTSHGSIGSADKLYIAPLLSSLVISHKPDSRRYLNTLQQVYDMVVKGNRRVVLKNDGVTTTVFDKTAGKSTVFYNEADAVEFAVRSYGLTKAAAEILATDKDVYLFGKVAFTQPAQPQDAYQGEQASQSMYATQHMPVGQQPYGQINAGMAQNVSQQQQPGQPGQHGGVTVNQQMLGAMADAAPVFDEENEMFDTGMLASLAHNEDIRGMMLDYLPTFDQALSSLGKSILLFSSSKEKLEGYYGREQYNTVLGNVRKVFRMLGEIVYDLKSYINMH